MVADSAPSWLGVPENLRRDAVPPGWPGVSLQVGLGGDEYKVGLVQGLEKFSYLAPGWPGGSLQVGLRGDEDREMDSMLPRVGSGGSLPQVGLGGLVQQTWRTAGL